MRPGLGIDMGGNRIADPFDARIKGSLLGLQRFQTGNTRPERHRIAVECAAMQQAARGDHLHHLALPFSYLELKDPKITRVVNSVDVIGNITLDVVFSPKRFVDNNPQIIAAFLAAQEEANRLIVEKPELAAEIFVQSSKVKVSTEEVLSILKDKDTRFSTTPDKVMNFADFMALAGSIKTKPKDWKELFIPQLHSRSGS